MSPFERIVAHDPAMGELLAFATRAAATDSTVLIEGESGVGKDRLALAIHYASPRAERPFIRIDCPNLSEDLLECELFGYEPGAFTDARGRKAGKFEIAEGGTVYVDGVDNLSPVLQTKLLRPLQEKIIERLGSTTSRKLDVRLIASTQRDLAQDVRAGTFRGDLFYRLQVIHLKVPPLRLRPTDIRPLILQLCSEVGGRLGKQSFRIEEDALAPLMTYAWPGNVREMRNLVERLAVMCDGDIVRRDEVAAIMPGLDANGGASKLVTLREMEYTYMNEVLRRLRGNKTMAAAALGISRKSFYDRMKREGVKSR